MNSRKILTGIAVLATLGVASALQAGTLEDVKARSRTVQKSRDSRGPRSGGRPRF